MVLGEGVVLDQKKIVVEWWWSGGGVVVDWWWIGWIRCYFVVLHIVNVLADSPFIKKILFPPTGFSETTPMARKFGWAKERCTKENTVNPWGRPRCRKWWVKPC